MLKLIATKLISEIVYILNKFKIIKLLKHIELFQTLKTSNTNELVKFNQNNI